METQTSARPYGAHIPMSWWKPIVIIVVLAVAMLGLQLVLGGIAYAIEVLALGKEPTDFSLTPLTFLATNLSLALLAPIAIGLMVWLGRVPWREVLRTGRSVSGRRLGTYLGIFAVLIAAVYAVTQGFVPMGLTGSVTITGTTIGLIVIALLTTPLQAAAEEIAFRGAVMPAIGAWVRAVRPALVIGLVGSSILFGLAHGAGDPWLIAYYVMFGAAMAAMAVISRGLEAPIAFHVVNNLISFVIGAVFSGGGGIEIDRSMGSGGPFMLIFIALDLVAVAIVWLLESRFRSRDRRPASAVAAPSTPGGPTLGTDTDDMSDRRAMSSSLTRAGTVAEVSGTHR